MLVDRDDAIATPHLLLEQVAEQTAAHRAVVVRGEALSLSGDQRRHERQGVELGVRVLQRGAGGQSLVHDQMHVRGVVRPDPGAPRADREAELLLGEICDRGQVLGSVHNHLV
jgi:hypothetical protein